MKGINLNIKYTIEVRDKNGKRLIKKTKPCRSLLRNFMYWFKQWFDMSAGGTYGSSWTTADTANVSRTFPLLTSSPQATFGIFGKPANDSTSGLRVGKGITAVDPTDYELATLLPHGTGTDQLVYNSQTVEAVTIVGSNTTFRVSRSFTNNSGVTITVKEIGAAMSLTDAGSTWRYILYLRDVLAASVPVPDGSTFTLRYTFTVTC